MNVMKNTYQENLQEKERQIQAQATEINDLKQNKKIMEETQAENLQKIQIIEFQIKNQETKKNHHENLQKKLLQVLTKINDLKRQKNVMDRTQAENFQKIQELQNQAIVMGKTHQENLQEKELQIQAQATEKNDLKIRIKNQEKEIDEKNTKIEKDEKLIKNLNHDLFESNEKLEQYINASERTELYYQMFIGVFSNLTFVLFMNSILLLKVSLKLDHIVYLLYSDLNLKSFKIKANL